MKILRKALWFILGYLLGVISFMLGILWYCGIVSCH